MTTTMTMNLSIDQIKEQFPNLLQWRTLPSNQRCDSVTCLANKLDAHVRLFEHPEYMAYLLHRFVWHIGVPNLQRWYGMIQHTGQQQPPEDPNSLLHVFVKKFPEENTSAPGSNDALIHMEYIDLDRRKHDLLVVCEAKSDTVAILGVDCYDHHVAQLPWCRILTRNRPGARLKIHFFHVFGGFESDTNLGIFTHLFWLHGLLKRKAQTQAEHQHPPPSSVVENLYELHNKASKGINEEEDSRMGSGMYLLQLVDRFVPQEGEETKSIQEFMQRRSDYLQSAQECQFFTV